MPADQPLQENNPRFEIATAIWLAMVNDEVPDDSTLEFEGYLDAADALLTSVVVPLADAEKLATALQEIAGLHESNKPGYCRRTAEMAETALAEFRAAHPREETT